MKNIKVNDKMQKNYAYILSELEGKNFDSSFRPDLTPKQMLELGVFGGVYMRDCEKEFPSDWFKKAKFAPFNKVENHKNNNLPDDNKHIASINYFGVNASQPLSVWKNKGWIYKEDPRGWFQWYCRYYLGRRIPNEDLRQIKRWRAMVRHVAQISHKCRVGDFSCNTRQRQALLHWAYDSRKM